MQMTPLCKLYKKNRQFGIGWRPLGDQRLEIRMCDGRTYGQTDMGRC